MIAYLFAAVAPVLLLAWLATADESLFEPTVAPAE